MTQAQGTMPRTQATSPAPTDAEERIAGIISRFEPKDRQLIQSVRNALRKRFPTLNELVYDYARNFVIGYSPTEAGGQGVVAISADAEGVRLYLTNGSNLPDPHKLLQGKGQARFMRLGSIQDLKRTEVVALMAAAEKGSPVPVPRSGRGAVIIKPGSSEKPQRKKSAKR